ncbi:MAG: hypothetical protein J7K88_06390 [Candidatus Fermentibacteraceae bacterium]|nr:hypothetical protein [Candidatus Fermentibacteraceae bacterium]
MAVSVETAEETQKQIDALGDNWEKQLITERGLRKIQKTSFEGALANPTQANALYLNVGSSSSDYINADIYSNLSLAGRSSVKTAIELHWVDSHNNTGSVAIGDTLRVIASDIEPIDLSDLTGTWSGDIKKIWLEFTSPNAISPADVRVGWVKLTE